MQFVPIQTKFTQDQRLLIAKGMELGLNMTEGESYRKPEQAWMNSLPPGTHIEGHAPDGRVFQLADTVGGSGINHSTHCNRLGKDYNFFDKNWKPINSKTPELIALGAYWESLDEGYVWGGNFTPTKLRPEGDIYHFEKKL